MDHPAGHRGRRSTVVGGKGKSAGLFIVPVGELGWKSVVDVEIAVAEYVDWYNHRRLHGEIGLVPPAEYETNHWASQPVEHYRKNPAKSH